MSALDRLRQYPAITTLEPTLPVSMEKSGDGTQLGVLAAMYEVVQEDSCFWHLKSPEKAHSEMQTQGAGVSVNAVHGV